MVKVIVHMTDGTVKTFNSFEEFEIGTHPEPVKGLLSEEKFRDFFYPSVIY
jgi:hypothetical protein